MAPEVLFERATLEHALSLASTMRDGDVAEVAACGFEPIAALRFSLGMSEVSLSMLFDGRVVAMFGVAPPGLVWLLTGRGIEASKRSFLRASRLAIGILLDQYPHLMGLIDSSYTAALRWAAWLGFEFGSPVANGPEGKPFIPAHIRRDTWAH